MIMPELQYFLMNFIAVSHTNTLIILCSSQLYPEYYEIIKEPIDLKTICTKLRVSSFISNKLDVTVFTLITCPNTVKIVIIKVCS